MASLLNRGVKHIVVKCGSGGANYYGLDKQCQIYTQHVDSYTSEVIDPTGAGDCFGATFVSLMLAGYDIEIALRYANASGALAVRQKGPMEGTSTLLQLQQFIASSTL